SNGYSAEFIFTTVAHRVKSLICNNITAPFTPISPPFPAPSFFVISYIDGVPEQFKNIVAK
ncbi:hypothetical protein EAG_05282, partial [Camponotus floridanus]